MINILLSGNIKVFDGALTELISITKKTKEAVTCFIMTRDLMRVRDDFKSITDEQIDFLNVVVQKYNKENKVIKLDVTSIYEKEFGYGKNENAYCTPYTLLRLFADMIPQIPDKILYLDIDMMIAGDIAELYNINIDDYEYAAVKEKYGHYFIRYDYINAGMLLLNIKKIKETGLLEKARNKIKTKKYLFADQDAIFWSTKKKKILPKKYNNQRTFNDKNTLVCHFCKRLIFLPYPKITNYKQWNIEEIHKYYKCHAFDDDLKDYIKEKENYEKRKKTNTNILHS